jgi:phage terminase large subunit-like protein
MRDTPQIRSIVERERERDPDNALREFDALFISGGAHAFFDARAIVDATDQNLRLPVARDPQARVFVGVDWGFVADSTAAVVVQAIGKMLFVSEVLELRPTKGAPLVPSEAAKSVGDAVQRYRGSAIVSDRYYVDAMAEHLNKTGISVLGAPEGQNGKSLAYTVARSLLHEGRVRLPQHGRLLAQLRQVVGKATSGGHIAISSPRWRTGGHGDLVSALVNALWQANEGNLYSYVPPSLPIDTRRPYDDCMGSNEITIGADGQAYFTPPRQQGGIFPPGSGGGF